VNTYIYIIRHADSVFCIENERNRQLTLKGMEDANIVTELLSQEEIDIIYSSPYRRSIQTIEQLSKKLSLDINLEEDLRESLWAGKDLEISELNEILDKCFNDQDFSLPGGESVNDVKRRGIKTLKKILQLHSGKKIAIGTHGNILTFILNHYDSRYSIDFLRGLTRPDIYKLEFYGTALRSVDRIWKVT
jgi:2,3-bisphosphoglycerate-dependent phosphoglycerate mutase